MDIITRLQLYLNDEIRFAYRKEQEKDDITPKLMWWATRETLERIKTEIERLKNEEEDNE